MKIQKITPIILLLIFNHYMAQNFWKNKEKKSAEIILTDYKTNDKLANKGMVDFIDFPQPKETDICVFIDPNFKYQKLIGIGGAITDASAETFAKLPKAQQTEFLEAYFGKNGIGYNLVRTNMASCDFSSSTYNYVKDNDKTLNSFDISRDKEYKIPLIKLAQKYIGNDFKLYFSPWSPPAWMKTNNSVLHGGSLKKEYYQTWANYYIKFIKAYQKEDLDFWGLTIQNEPMANQIWESCIYTAEEEGDFLKNNLGPTLWKNGFKDKKVMIWDHNRDLIYQRATTTLNTKEALKYASGIGFHWYETWTKSKPMFNNLAETHKAFPDKFLLFTEGCKELFDYSKIYDVRLGELYGRNMINDFNNGSSGFTDWNILLDQTGGPNHVGNFCFAPIIADTKTGKLHYTYEYYYIGQFSKYIKPGAQRVGNTSNRDFIQSTSFLNTNGQLVTVVMNESDNETPVNVWINGKSAKLIAPPHSIQTMIL
jgi:glucosylceramidase